MALRQVVPLDEKDTWVFHQVTDLPSEWLKVRSMPTNVHTDLLFHGFISDPRLGTQENDCQWVGEKSWVYRGMFSAPDDSAKKKAVLAFAGLDTYATILLNGQEICKTQDMFIPERVDINLEEENVLDIVFDPTYITGKKLVEQYPDHHWGCWNGDPSRLAVRKAQFHYGWDWGPTLLTCGPWRPIFLEIYDARISDLSLMTDVDRSLDFAEIVARTDIEGEGDKILFEVFLDGAIVGTETTHIEDGTASATFKTRKPKLWYPHPYGRQPLYVLSATLYQDNNILDTASKSFGLRRAKVIQRKLDDAVGLTFLFEINNIPLFCGGSNWIPADNFTPLIGAERYRKWVKMAVDGNQIMLRAWGGGIFEEDAFYNACDEMGVLVWQDFLFACGNYPTHPDFLSLVKREATENVKLLRHHPSIVIWAGNNEDYQYCETEHLDYDPSDQDPESWLTGSFPARYIYEKILVDVTEELIPGTYYHFGSPYGGKNTTDPYTGDIHQWNVWHGSQEKYQDFDKLTGRFVSEFGMEAFPNIRTVDNYLLEGKLEAYRYPQSSIVDFHNKAAGQERRLALYLAENIRYSMEPLEQHIYSTQLMQAECLSTAYRLWKRQWKGPGREYCSGALVWQLNDVWPGQSWSIVDYYLRPKMAYYAIKRELQPITLGMKRTIETIPADKYTRAYIRTVHKIQMWACSLSLEDYEAKISVCTYDLVTGQRREWPDLGTNVRLLSNRSTEISDFTVPFFREKADEAKEDVDGHLQNKDEEWQIVVAAYLYIDDKQTARAINWPEPLKYVHFPKPTEMTLRLTSSICGPEGPGCVESGLGHTHEADKVVVSADVPVKGLVVEVADLEEMDTTVVLEDNGVDLVPGESVSIGVNGLNLGDEHHLSVRYLGM